MARARGRAGAGGAEHRRSRSSATLNNSNNGERLTATGERGPAGVCGDVAVVRDGGVMRVHAVNHAKEPKM